MSKPRTTNKKQENIREKKVEPPRRWPKPPERGENRDSNSNESSRDSSRRD